MVRARSGVIAVALLALVLLLTGCIATPPNQLSAGQRDLMRQVLADSRWSSVTAQFPRANRPPPVVTRTIADHDWAPTIEACLHAAGFSVRQDANGTQYQGAPLHAPIDFAIAEYSCMVAFPRVSDLVGFLDRHQIDALYRYYVANVRPCLLAAGVPSTAPPTRFAFVTSLLTRQSWHPFDAAWAAQLPFSELLYVEQLCRPVPKWLDLHTADSAVSR